VEEDRWRKNFPLGFRWRLVFVKSFWEVWFLESNPYFVFFWLTGGKSVRLWDKGSRSLGVFPSGNQQRPKWAKTGALNASKICEHRCGFVEENLQGKHWIKLLHSSAFPQDIFGNGETIFEGKEGHSGRPLAEALRHGRNRVNPQ